MPLGWLLRIPSLVYFEWLCESSSANLTTPANYFVQMMQSMFIVPVTDNNVFPSINLILQFFLYIIAFVCFISVAIFNLSVVKKLYVSFLCISLFVMGCNQYKLILYKLNSIDDTTDSLSSKWVTYDSSNQSFLGYWNIYLVDFIQFIPISQFKSASLVLILPLIYCPWLIFVQYFNIMSNQVMALSYGIANLPGLCLALNLPVEAQIFTYNFAVTSFLIGIIYKIVTVCVILPRTLSDFLADLFVVINFNNHAAAWVEIPSVLWSLFDLSRQFLVFWLALFLSNMFLSFHKFSENSLFLILASISESVQTPLGFVGFSVMSCYLSRLVLAFVDWLVEGAQFDDRNRSHGIAEGFSTLLMMISLDRSALKVTSENSVNSPQHTNSIEKSSPSSIGLIVLVILIISSSVLESASEFLASKLVHLTATASSAKKWRKHFFPLVLNTAVFVLPILICYHVRGMFVHDLWLATIMGSFLITSLHTVNSFVAYCLYLTSEGKPLLPLKWDVEVVIMGLNFIVQCVELCIAVGLIFLLILRAFSGHWNTVSSILLIVHFYFNIFERIRLGWANFSHRRSVTNELDRLYTVSDKEEILQIADLCAICFSDLSFTDLNGPVKRTVCQHFFHKECLKKWLFIKHSCPMCAANFNETDDDNRPFRAGLSDVSSESDTESRSDYSNEDEFVPSTTSESSIYDDKDIDLKVYQDIEDEEQGASNSGSITRSGSLTPDSQDDSNHSDEPVLRARLVKE